MLRGEQTLNSSYQGDETTDNDVTLLFLKSCWSLFMYLFGCAGSLLLRRPFSNCDERSSSLVVVLGLLIAVASLVERGLSGVGASGAQNLGHMGLDAMQHVGSSPIRDQIRCLLHWQADSLPLNHQGIPHSLYLHCRGMAFFPSWL